MSKKKKDWRAEKERLLSLGQEERRKEYGDNYVVLDKIRTWRQHHGRESEEEQENPVSLCDKVSLYKGDITILEVDAIVNAANTSLLGGGGVDGCIHRAAGHYLYEECHSLNGCETGQAKITCGYDLPAKYVIHTVGPIARGNVGQVQKDDLESCYTNSLKLVEEKGLRSVAFPCISTGIYGFPNEPAANIALNTVKNWLKDNKDKIDRIIFCVFLENDYQIYNRKLSHYFPRDNEECEEGTAAHTEDDDVKNHPDDVHMDSQVDQDDDDDDDMLSQRDMEVNPCDTPSQHAEISTPAAENPAKEKTTESSDREDDEKSAGESKPDEEKEKDEEKDDSEEADDITGIANEKSVEEKTEIAPAETELAEEEEAQVTSMNCKETDSHGLAESMEVEGELKRQDKSLAETNPATQTDSSQSKDGSVNSGEPSKA